MIKRVLFSIFLLVTSLILAYFQSEYQFQQATEAALSSVGDTESAVVARVIDGDTIELESGLIVRLIGVDTSEMSGAEHGECFAVDAKQYMSQLLLDKQVLLEIDTSQTDRYGRLLRYIWVDEQLVNEQLVREGYAVAKAYKPDTARQQLFETAQTRARSERVGMWAACDMRQNPAGDYYVAGFRSSNTQVQPTLPTTTEPIVSPDPEECQIKGNISDAGKLFHLPSCPSYSRVLISEDKGEQWFCTQEQAVDAGWILSPNCPE